MKDHREAEDRHRVGRLRVRVLHRNGLAGGRGQGDRSGKQQHDDGDEDEVEAEEAGEVDLEICEKVQWQGLLRI